ncbi:hypothetical protein [Microcoleus sp. FACHB-672]|uniref:hypothetical protein n=1 Tax=Microcoleus sp. FACHB-672 TaxID=2692825 RepID=UPI001686A264|nr:hypothetical protein [Microcoleus sp. FACHB-672]MBD2040751.1 hypothetical protein [Microcoleus sp. FACHB-672]
MMTQQNILTLAKQGNPQAIKVLINQSLQSKGITVKVGIKNDCLMVFAESNNPPDQSLVVNFIRKGMMNLKPESVQRVVVQGHTAGNTAPAWREKFDLNAGSAATLVQPPATAQPPISKSPAAKKTPPNNAERPQQPSSNQTEPITQILTPPKPLHPVLSFIKNFIFISLYVLCTVGLAALAFGVKLAAILVAERFIYEIQIVGDVLRGIQIIEILNILVFAILGMGFGVATILLPRKVGVPISSLLIIILLPVIFCTTDIVKYSSWVNEIAERDNLEYVKAEQLTNAFLKSRVGQQGFLGFYIHTAEFPVLPTKKAEMESVGAHKQKVTSRFATITKIDSKKIAALFSISGWGIRAFYFLVAVMTTIIHFREGLSAVKILSKPSFENEPYINTQEA